MTTYQGEGISKDTSDNFTRSLTATDTGYLLHSNSVLRFQFTDFSNTVCKSRLKIGNGERHLLDALITLEYIGVKTSFTSAQRLIFPVSFEEPSLHFFDLFHQVVVLSGNRAWTLHDAFKLLFKVCKTLVASIEESTHPVSDVTQTLSLFFQSIVGGNFCIVLSRFFFKLMFQRADFIRSNRGKSCICGLF